MLGEREEEDKGKSWSMHGEREFARRETATKRAFKQFDHN